VPTGAVFGGAHNSVSSKINRTISLVEIMGIVYARIEFDSADTAVKQLGDYTYDVQIESGGKFVTILEGAMELRRDYAVVS